MTIRIETPSSIFGGEASFFETFTFHCTEQEAEDHPETVETVQEERYSSRADLEAEVALSLLQGDCLASSLEATAERNLWADYYAALEEGDDKAIEKALEDLEDKHATAITGGAMPKHPAPNMQSLQASAATVSQSAKRCGRGAVNKDRSSREADRRLRGVYRAEARVWEEIGLNPEWEDRYTVRQQILLAKGCPDTGLGPCRCDPTVFLELRALLLLAQRGAEGGLYSPAR